MMGRRSMSMRQLQGSASYSTSDTYNPDTNSRSALEASDTRNQEHEANLKQGSLASVLGVAFEKRGRKKQKLCDWHARSSCRPYNEKRKILKPRSAHAKTASEPRTPLIPELLPNTINASSSDSHRSNSSTHIGPDFPDL